MFPYAYTEHAIADILRYAASYEIKQAGLGARFVKEVEQAAVEISILPRGYASYYKSTRERKTRHFPYKLIYIVEEDIIFIHAVYPCKANPAMKYKRIPK